jgi:hypothetical protein
MTWLALSLYALGLVGAATAVGRDAHGRDVPAGLRERVVVIFWPIAVGAAICLALADAVRRGAQR